MASLLEGLRGKRVEVRRAERGDKRRLQEMADRNAVLALTHERLKEERSRERRLGALTALEEALGLEGPPMRIEGFDISNLGDENVVASMVVFEGGVAKKSDYRKFSIRTTGGQNDVGAMREALAATLHAGGWRRQGLRPVVRGGAGPGAHRRWQGTAGRRGGGAAARPVWTRWCRSSRWPSARRRCSCPGRPDPLELAADDIGVLLLRRVRDEAHRFAVGFHRAKRAVETTSFALGSTAGCRGDAQAGDTAALRVAGALLAGHQGGAGGGPRSAGQGGKGGACVCPQDG